MQKEIIDGDIKKIISYEEREEAMVKVSLMWWYVTC